MLSSKIAQRVIVHRHPATQPDVGQMIDAQFGHGAGTRLALTGRIHPHGQQQQRVGRGRARCAIVRLDLHVELGQVQALDGLPDLAGQMVRRDQVLQTGGHAEYPLSIRTPQTQAARWVGPFARRFLRERRDGRIRRERLGRGLGIWQRRENIHGSQPPQGMGLPPSLHQASRSRHGPWPAPIIFSQTLSCNKSIPHID